MNKAKTKILVLIIIFLGIGFIAKIMILDNEDVLFSIAAGLDVPSKSYYLVIERIYRISENENIGDKILSYLVYMARAVNVTKYLKKDGHKSWNLW